MGIQINGQTDIISATDGSLTIQGASGNLTGDLTGNVTGNINSSGVSTLGNTVVGGGTTQLVVTGNARITGILTIGTSSITLDGSNNQVNVGTGVTLHHTNGVQVGGNNLHSTVLTVNNINASGVSTFSSGIVVAAGSSAAPSITPTGDSNTGIFFPSADTIAFGEGGVETMRVNSSGELLIGTSTRTANGGVLQVSNGITFPATQSACSDPNTLDDYEVGTFTPVFGIGSGITYAQQLGKYTKIGDRVLFNIFLTWSANSNTGGNASLGGFPYAVTDALSSYGAATFTNNSLSLPAGSYNIVAQISPTQPTIFLFGAVSGGSKSNFPYQNLGGSGEIIMSGQYGASS